MRLGVRTEVHTCMICLPACLHYKYTQTVKWRFSRAVSQVRRVIMMMMQKKLWLVCLMVVVVLMAQQQQSQGHKCGSTFFSALVQLIPCKAAVAPFSPILPSDTCCNAIRALGQPCLCLLINGPPISGVDRNMALQLPAKCTINFDPCDLMK